MCIAGETVKFGFSFECGVEFSVLDYCDPVVILFLCFQAKCAPEIASPPVQTCGHLL
jgi:hypothetical protein